MKNLNIIEKAFLLKKTRLFGNLDLDLLLTISDKMELVSFEANEKIFNIKQDANRMYLIVEGTVLIRDNSKKILAELKGGDFFGDESLFNEKPRTYEAISQTDTVHLTLSRIHLLTIISECPTVAVGLLEAYTAAIDFRIR